MTDEHIAIKQEIAALEQKIAAGSAAEQTAKKGACKED